MPSARKILFQKESFDPMAYFPANLSGKPKPITAGGVQGRA
jgi:hypothetical protein